MESWINKNLRNHDGNESGEMQKQMWVTINEVFSIPWNMEFETKAVTALSAKNFALQKNVMVSNGQMATQ